MKSKNENMRRSSYRSVFILPLIVLLFVSTFYSNIAAAQTEPNFDDDPFEYRGLYLQEYETTKESINVEDPKLLLAPDEEEVLAIEDWGTAATGCLASIMGNYVGGAIKAGLAAIGGLVGLGASAASDIPVVGSLLSLEVPVTVDDLEVKDTGTSFGPFGITPSLDAVGYCLGNLIIERILTSTTEWVKGGFNGNPTFVDDPEQFFLDIADVEAGTFLNDMVGFDLCSPWDIEIRLALLKAYTSTEIDACTLTEITENLDGFLNNSFEEGGWKGWFKLTQEPNNNPYDVYADSRYAMSKRISGSQNKIEAELTWSKGFLSVRNEDGTIGTPGTLLEGTIQQHLGIPAERMTFADEFDELMDAFINTIVLKTVTQVLE